jgi:hypothetical protein
MISKSNRRAPASVPGWGRQAWDRLPLVEHSTHKDQTSGPAPGPAGPGGSAGDGHRIDPEFAGLPLREFSAAALERARELGAEHADFRAERIRGQEIGLSDGHLETLLDADELGLAVRVVLNGTWGFAAAVDLTRDAAVRAAEEAIDVAKVAAAMNTERIDLAPEPGYGDVSWVSAYQQDPFSVNVADKLALLSDWSARLLASPVIDHVDASLLQVRECKFYSDGATTATQQRVRLHPVLTAVAVEPSGRFETMRTLAPPAGRAGPAAGPAGREAGRARGPGGPLRPGHPPVQPVAGDPRVDRACHRARPGARLRGGLRRDLVRDPGQARPAPVRIAVHAGHR